MTESSAKTDPIKNAGKSSTDCKYNGKIESYLDVENFRLLRELALSIFLYACDTHSRQWKWDASRDSSDLSIETTWKTTTQKK